MIYKKILHILIKFLEIFALKIALADHLYLGYSVINGLYPLFLLHIFMAYGSKNFFEKNFGGFQNPSGGGGRKIFFET